MNLRRLGGTGKIILIKLKFYKNEDEIMKKKYR